MKITFDRSKSEKNALERGLPFESAADFDWQGATFAENERKEYPERRFVAIGYLWRRLHILCFTHIPRVIRVISFRKANPREAKRYEKPLTID